jgi:hypothetical protein
MSADIDQVGQLLQRKAQSLRRFDDPQHRHRLYRIQPVPTEGAVRLGEQAPPLVLTQRLQIHPGRLGDLPATQPGHARTSATRAANPVRTDHA